MNDYKEKRTELIVVISVLSVLLVTLIGFMVYYYFAKNEKSTPVSTTPPMLNIVSCPEQVTSDDPYATIEGIVLSEMPGCTVSINGVTVATTTSAGTQTKWSGTYKIEPGETTTFKIVAEDKNNLKTEAEKTIYCQPLSNYTNKTTSKKSTAVTPGCTFVKKKPGGLNIRKYAGTNYAVVDFINKNDYTSEMTFTGYYQVDGSGYTWYEIISPKGKHGYVRSDLVRVN